MPQVYFDTPSSLRYDPAGQDKAFSMIYDELQRRSGEYEKTSQLIPEAKAIYESTPVADADIPFLNRTARQLKENIDTLTQKYNGDYGDPRFKRELTSELAKVRSNMARLTRRYEEHQKMLPYYMANKQDIFFDIDPVTGKRTNPLEQPSFSEDNKFIGAPDYSRMLTRPDYGDIVYGDIGRAVDQMVTEGLISPTNRDAFLQTITTKGLGAITNPEIRKRIESYIPEFLAKTPFLQDPAMEQYHEEPERFIENVLQSRVSSGLQRQLMQDPDYLARLRDQLKGKKAVAGYETFESIPMQGVKTPGVESIKEIAGNKPNFWHRTRELFTGKELNYSDLDEDGKKRLGYFVDKMPEDYQKLYKEMSSKSINKDDILHDIMREKDIKVMFGDKRKEVLEERDRRYQDEMAKKAKLDDAVSSIMKGLEEEQQVGSYLSPYLPENKDYPNLEIGNRTDYLFGLGASTKGLKSVGAGNLVNRWVYDPDKGDVVTGQEFYNKYIKDKEGVISANGKLTISNPFYYLTGNEDFIRGEQISVNGKWYIMSSEKGTGKEKDLKDLGDIFTEIRFINPGGFKDVRIDKDVVRLTYIPGTKEYGYKDARFEALINYNKDTGKFDKHFTSPNFEDLVVNISKNEGYKTYDELFPELQ